MKYYVLDSYGMLVRAFQTWKEANNFRIVMQRFDWRITNEYRR